ncbi:hypothetical protein [Microbispora rosea]
MAIGAGHDGTLQLWDMSTGAREAHVTLPNAAHALAGGPEGEIVVAFGWEVTVLEWVGAQMGAGR